MQRRFLRYHPVLPTTDEAATDYNLVTADHVPHLAHIDDITVLIWNVLQFDSGNGFASLEDGLSYKETDAERQARHARISAAIKRITDIHQPPFIALQEITDRDPGLLDAILNILADEYGCVQRDDGTRSKTGGVVTLFRRSALLEPPQHEDITNRIGTSSTRFTLANGKTGRLFNVHPMYSQIIAHAETGITEYLLDTSQDDDYAIVAGDFNAHIAPISEVPQSITTCVAAPFFRDKKRQGAAAVDGAFYWLRHERRLTQADCDHLDPATGQVISLKELAPLPVAELNESQNDEVTEPRMIVSIDYRHAQRKFIDNKFTLLQYQQILRDKYNSKSILVRAARDLNNEPYIAIAYPSMMLKGIKWAPFKHLYNNVLKQLGTEYQYDDDYSKKRHTIVYIPSAAIKLDANNLPLRLNASSSISSEDSDSDTNSEDDDKQANFLKRNHSTLAVLALGLGVMAGIALSGGLLLPAVASIPLVIQIASWLLLGTKLTAGLLVGAAALIGGGFVSLLTWGIVKCIKPSGTQLKSNKIPDMPLLDVPPTPPRSLSTSIPAPRFSTSTSRMVPPLRLQLQPIQPHSAPEVVSNIDRLSASSLSLSNSSVADTEISSTREESPKRSPVSKR
jgi:hypothetical protein